VPPYFVTLTLPFLLLIRCAVKENDERNYVACTYAMRMFLELITIDYSRMYVGIKRLRVKWVLLKGREQPRIMYKLIIFNTTIIIKLLKYNYFLFVFSIHSNTI
jgi:hypothetical protein